MESMLKIFKQYSCGFSLIEFLLYIAISVLVIGFTTGIFITSTKLQNRTIANTAVLEQSNFAIETVSWLIKYSQNIEIADNSPTSTIKLRMKDPAKDPTCIALESGIIKIYEGPLGLTGDNAKICTTTGIDLTSSKVKVDQMLFTKIPSYPAHDSVTVGLTMSYNTNQDELKASHSLRTAILRVSAATFDADLVPGSAYTYNIGQAGSPWQRIYMGDGTAALPSYTFSSDNDTGLYRPGEDILGFSTAGSERMRISTSGNVGIGTTSPAAILYIQKDQNDSTQQSITNATAGASSLARLYINSDSAGGVLAVYSGSNTDTPQFADRAGLIADSLSSGLDLVASAGAGDMRFYTGGSATANERVRITNTGNVGIGTAAPRYALQVNSSGYPMFRGTTAGGNGTAFTDSDTIPINSNNGFYGYNGISVLSNVWGGNTVDAHRVVYIGGAQRNSGYPSSVLAFGNWGYFTGTGAAAGELGNAAAQGDAVKFRIENTDVGAEFSQRLDFITRNASGSNALAMAILSSGNVGIGTTGPGAKLDINGNLRISANNPTLDWGSNTLTLGSKDDVIPVVKITGSTTYSPRLELWTSGGATRNVMFVGSGDNYINSGNVGIGTTSPATELHVNSSDSTNLRVEAGGTDNNAALQLRNDARGWQIYVDGTDSDKLKFRDTTDSETWMTIQENGNVGIGTTTPAGKLEIAGTSNDLLVLNRTLETVEQAWYLGQNSKDFVISTSAISGLAGAKLVIQEDTGNLGIGTTTPGNILTIAQNSATDPISDAWTVYSSRRWKTNITPITGALDKVRDLEGVYFNWKADGKHDLGMIAEDVGKVIPEVVVYEENGIDVKSLDYARLATVLVEAIKEQQKEIETLKQVVSKLKDNL